MNCESRPCQRAEAHMNEYSNIKDWFAQWSAFVANVDFESARALFDESVVGFGTYKDLVHGLDNLETGQWRNIWPTIADFAFDLDSLEVIVSTDGSQASAVIFWDSTGFHEDGSRYDRPGRATVVLKQIDGEWRGVHTHFSLRPAEKKLSFGRSDD